MEEKKRKYEVTLPDGRVVSRQYANYLKNIDTASLRHREAVKRYQLTEGYDEKRKKWSDNFNKRFLDKNGITYSKWYYSNVIKKAKNNGN